MQPATEKGGAADGGAGVSLWRTPDDARAFMIPDDALLPPGDVTIKTARSSQSVDWNAIAGFEVSPEQAERWLRDELGRVLRKLGGSLRRSFASSPPPAHDPPAPPEAPVTPGLDLLAAITGTPRADLDAGGGAVVEALRRYASDLGGTVAGSVSGYPARIAGARARMAEWAATLREHGTEVAASGPAAGPPPAAGEAPTAKAPTPEQTPEHTSKAEGASGVAARLHALADDFRRRADALAAAHGAGDPTDASTAGLPSVAHDGGTGPPIAPTSAETQAAALEALAEGLEDAAGDAAARLRAQAARLRGGS